MVAEAANGIDAWDAFLEHEPDVCFLDIRMPGLGGIDVARRIAGRAPVIFVSAYGDHALAAFDAGALDYVLKPVDRARLAQAGARLNQRVPPATADLQARLDRLATPPRRTLLRVLQAAVGREVRLIQVEDVIYFESDTRYTRVVTHGGEALLRTPLKELLLGLDDQQFWQVHRSIIVNHRHIGAAVRGDDGSMHLTLRNRSEQLPVSRHFQPLFKGQ